MGKYSIGYHDSGEPFIEGANMGESLMAQYKTHTGQEVADPELLAARGGLIGYLESQTGVIVGIVRLLAAPDAAKVLMDSLLAVVQYAYMLGVLHAAGEAQEEMAILKEYITRLEVWHNGPVIS